MNSERAENVPISLGQGIDTQGHDDLGDKLDKGGLNHLDDDQAIAPGEREGCEEKWKGLRILPKARTTNRWASVEHEDRRS